MLYAHSLEHRPLYEWEPLGVHLQAVAQRAAEFAGVFHWAEIARAGGPLHDIGKASDAFQRYIKGEGGAKGPDHSTAGAREAVSLYPGMLGRMLAFPYC